MSGNWITYQYCAGCTTANGDNGHNLFHAYAPDCVSKINNVGWVNANAVYNESNNKFPCAQNGNVEACLGTTDTIGTPDGVLCDSEVRIPGFTFAFMGMCNNDPTCQ